MRLTFLLVIAAFLLTTPSLAQRKKKTEKQPVVDSTEVVITRSRTTKKSRLELRAAKTPQQDTTFVLHYSERSITRDSAGIQHVTYEGNVSASVMEYRVMAERIDYYSETGRVVAVGNVTVIHQGLPIPAQRFEWQQNDPTSPVIEPR
jgi:lipopolysaccharide assembly outer membrane protein LptD (OstA)